MMMMMMMMILMMAVVMVVAVVMMIMMMLMLVLLLMMMTLMLVLMMMMMMMTTFQARFEVFLMCFFVCLGFLKRILMPDIFIHNILKLRRHLGTKTYGRFPWQFCNFRCEIIN